MLVFEMLLLDDHNKIVLDLLFDVEVWHVCVKLHIYTEDTLTLFDTTTMVLSQSVWKFSNTTYKHYHTTELPHEYAAQGR
jgi:hypothetical protein